jgi:hypothetical protein
MRKQIPIVEKAISRGGSPEMVELLEQQKQRFVKKFGRQPGPTDPVFFDDLATTPKALDASALVTHLDSLLDQARRRRIQ